MKTASPTSAARFGRSGHHAAVLMKRALDIAKLEFFDEPGACLGQRQPRAQNGVDQVGRPRCFTRVAGERRYRIVRDGAERVAPRDVA